MEEHSELLKLQSLLKENGIPFGVRANERLEIEVAAIFYPSITDYVFKIIGWFSDCDPAELGLTIANISTEFLTAEEVYETIKHHKEEGTV